MVGLWNVYFGWNENCDIEMNCEIVMRWECEYWDEMWNVLRNENGDLKCVYEWKGWLLGIVGLCDRESWAGRIATHVCEMVRLSRADSLVGGHLIEKCEMRTDMRKEMKWIKCEEMWGWVIRIWIDEFVVILIWLMVCKIDLVVNCLDCKSFWLILERYSNKVIGVNCTLNA